MTVFPSTFRASWRFLLQGMIMALVASTTLRAQAYRYQVDLKTIVADRFPVTLECQTFARDTIFFCFPKIVPGTYQVSDYGRYIKDLKAYDSKGQVLPVKKIDRNRYRITPADRLAKIEYWVEDTWDYKFSKLWGMAGTNNEAGENFVWNNGGVFGFFPDALSNPVEIQVTCPDSLYAITALPGRRSAADKWQFQACSYYHLIDSPIIFALPDTASFTISSSRIRVGVDHKAERGKLAPPIAAKLSASMQAIASFLDTLPTTEYTFIYYFDDASRLGQALEAKHFQMLKIIAYLLKNGIPGGGALEHCNSSFYYLPDLGPQYRPELLKSSTDEIAIHEFMHTLTPLRLHSAIIGNMDFLTPQMSQHLWLYEGVTEYLTHLIRVRQGLISQKEFLFKVLPSKIRTGEKYPYQKMPFTVMSAKVLDKKYQRQFLQVYQRGAVIAMLLDIEIMRLTHGEKDLATVLWQLCCRYGEDQSFSEGNFFDEFVALVHPSLRTFFSKYVAGTEPLPLDSILEHVGIIYTAEQKIRAPRHYIQDNDIKTGVLRVGDLTSIKKVGRKDFVGFQPADIVNVNLYHELFLDSLGNYLPEGTLVNLAVTRAGQSISIPVKISYTKKTISHRLQLTATPTEDQKFLFKRWLKGKVGEEYGAQIN